MISRSGLCLGLLLAVGACDDAAVSPVDDPARPVVLKYSCCSSPGDDPTPDSLFTNLGIAWLERDTVREDDFNWPSGPRTGPFRIYLGEVICPSGDTTGLGIADARLFLQDKEPDPVKPERARFALDLWHSCSGYLRDIAQTVSYRSTADSLFFYGLEPDSLLLFHPRMAWYRRPNLVTLRFITISPEEVLTERNVFLQREISAPDTVN